jgi:integrase
MPRVPKPFFHRGGWYTDAGGTRTLLAEGEENYEQAQKELAKHLLKLHHKRQTGRKTSNPGIRLKQLIDLFLDEIQLTAATKTYQNYIYGFTKVVEVFKNPRAISVRRADVLDLRKKLAGQHGPAVVNRALECLKRLYNWASDTEVIDEYNPARKVAFLEEEPRSRLMTPVEFELLVSKSCPEFRDVLVSMRYTSARPGEIRTLQWPMIDWEKKVWVLPRHKTSRTTKVKTPRVICFPPVVEEVLRKREKEKGGSPFVFLNRLGKPWSAVNISRHFGRVRARAGLGPDTQGEELVLYSNRHTLLTQAVRNGATGPQLQLLGGWTNLETARHYIHLGEHDVYQAGMKAAEGVQKMDGQKPNDR